MRGEEKRGEEEKRGVKPTCCIHIRFTPDFIMSYIGFAIKSYVVKSNYPKISHIQHEIVVIFLFAIMSPRRLKILHCLLSLEKGT